eukprot:3783725-Prymnesium_polylepis.1
MALRLLTASLRRDSELCCGPVRSCTSSSSFFALRSAATCSARVESAERSMAARGWRDSLRSRSANQSIPNMARTLIWHPNIAKISF